MTEVHEAEIDDLLERLDAIDPGEAPDLADRLADLLGSVLEPREDGDG